MKDFENILIVGSGGREHALGWKILNEPHVKKVYHANGNGGTFENIPISPIEIEKLASFAKDRKCFTIVGPELPLSLGIVDLFNANDLPIFGPTKSAAMLETSKKYSKTFMKENSIPTSEFQVFDNSSNAIKYVEKLDYDVVIKADGLASGKGVFVTKSKQEAFEAIHLLLDKKIFGEEVSNEIVIEKKIIGEEVSVIALCDGNSFILLDPCKDHKRLLDNNNGPNTGGMGSYSPVSTLSDEEIHIFSKKIFKPTLNGMSKIGNPFKGFLYAGLLLEEKSKTPYVLEYNVRMGDPECQPLMMRMESDLLDYLIASHNQSLDSIEPIKWKNKHSVCIIMATKGYPSKIQMGYSIKGLENIDKNDLKVFHSGTRLSSSKELLTNGGRVLGVTSLGNHIEDARFNAYENVAKISWGNDDQYYRKDIAKSTTNLCG